VTPFVLRLLFRVARSDVHATHARADQERHFMQPQPRSTASRRAVTVWAYGFSIYTVPSPFPAHQPPVSELSASITPRLDAQLSSRRGRSQQRLVLDDKHHHRTTQEDGRPYEGEQRDTVGRERNVKKKKKKKSTNLRVCTSWHY